MALFLTYQAGVINKLISQAFVSKRQSIGIDFFWVTSASNIPENAGDLNVIRVDKSNLFRVRMKQLQVINSLLDNYDKLIIRYPLVDPVFTLRMSRKNRIVLEHHSKEVEQLLLTRDPRYIPERLFGGRWMRTFAGLIGVTPEIVEYEVARSSFEGPTTYIPNSIDVVSQATAAPLVGNTAPTVAVMVANFRQWHGLDGILDEVERYNSTNTDFVLHVVGDIPQALQRKAARTPGIRCHGFLNQAEIRDLYDVCHVGIGPFDLQSRNMHQATSLKVREYAAAGLPVAIAGDDPAFPSSYPYLLRQTAFDVQDIVDFSRSHRQVSRPTIRESATPHIDSAVHLTRLYDWIVCG